MAELKTKKTQASVASFLDTIEDKQKRADCKVVSKMMREATGNRAKMWGTGVVGFGSYHYKYASGREGNWFEAGFAPRKQALTLYIMPGFSQYDKLMAKLGKYKTGKSCLYINSLKDVDQKILSQLIKQSVIQMRKKYGKSSA